MPCASSSFNKVFKFHWQKREWLFNLYTENIYHTEENHLSFSYLGSSLKWVHRLLKGQTSLGSGMRHQHFMQVEVHFKQEIY